MAEPTAARAVAALGRLVLNYRLISVLLALLWQPAELSLPGLTIALLVALLANFVPLWRWERVAPLLMRHPAFLAVDLLLSLGILVFTGTDGPFLSYTLGTAVLAGVLYGWRGGAVLATLLTAGYYCVLALRAPVLSGPLEFEQLIGVPSRYVLFALGAAAVRGLLIRQAEAEAALAVAARTAAMNEERGRLAREMHDTLAKTLHGVALSARALPLWLARDPERAARDAGAVACAAEAAAAQARELIGDLRSDRLEQSLDSAVARFARDWSQAAGIPASVEVEAVGDQLDPGVRYEVFQVLSEALRNVERHAHARRVWVSLTGRPDGVVLTVADDGVGLPAAQRDLPDLAARGHFGLVGIAERAERIGARWRLDANHPSGLVLTVVVPPAQVPRQAAHAAAALEVRS